MDHITEERDSTVLGQLRAKRRKAAEETTTDLPVPGYDGELVIRYRLLDPLVEGKAIGDRLERQFKAADQDSERVYYGLVDGLIAACVAVFAKVGDALVPLAGEGTVTTLEDTDDLAELLGFEPCETARETVEAILGDKRIIVSGYARRLQMWMGDPSGELNRGIFG